MADFGRAGLEITQDEHETSMMIPIVFGYDDSIVWQAPSSYYKLCAVTTLPEWKRHALQVQFQAFQVKPHFVN